MKYNLLIIVLLIICLLIVLKPSKESIAIKQNVVNKPTRYSRPFQTYNNTLACTGHLPYTHRS